MQKLWITERLIHIWPAKPDLGDCGHCGSQSPRRVSPGCHLGRVVLRRVMAQVNARLDSLCGRGGKQFASTQRDQRRLGAGSGTGQRWRGQWGVNHDARELVMR